MNDQALFAHIAKKAGDVGLLLEATERLSDSALLADIAKSDAHEWVRIQAIRNHNLNDQALFAHIAKKAGDVGLRRAAAERLSDPALLADVAKNVAEELVLDVVIGRLSDQDLLADIAKNDTHERFRDIAVGRLSDPALLADLAKHAYSLKAVGRLSDPALLADIAKNVADRHIRRAAVLKLKDPALLADIAKKDADADVRQAAIENKSLEDLNLFTDIHQNDPNVLVRAAAGGRLVPGHASLLCIQMKYSSLEEQASELADMAKNHADYEFRLSAVQNEILSGRHPALLADIAQSDPNKWVRWAAVQRLDDPTLLSDIAEDDADEEVRQAARARLASSDW